MALGTIIYSSLSQQPSTARALVLMGGGARTAYQVGVLKATASMLVQTGKLPADQFPFSVLVGTSAGAINAACLAGEAEVGFLAKA